MTPLPPLDATFVATVVFIFGLMIGSFLNVVIFRLPAEESIAWPGSHCPKCDTPLTAWENIPVVSWLVLGAKCKTCKSPISWRYPATELATGLLFLAVYLAFGLTLQSLFLWVLVGLMVVTFWIDIDTMMIYDQVTFPGIALGLLYSWLIADQFWFSLAACLYAVAFLMLINSLTVLAIGEDGVGGGDMTLVAMLGAWLGLQETVLAVGLSMVIGSAMGLGMLFRRWGQAGRWQPFALAAVVTPFAYVAGCFLALTPFNSPASGWWFGATLDPLVRLAVFAMAALLGACAGWIYMRTAEDEGRLMMPFGPALVLGGLGALFWGGPMIGWYLQRLGS